MRCGRFILLRPFRARVRHALMAYQVELETADLVRLFNIGVNGAHDRLTCSE